MLSRLHLLSTALLLLLISVSEKDAFAQSNIDQATLTEAGERTPEISTAELRIILREHQAVVIDTRPFKEYAMGHIPGAFDAAVKPGVPMALYISDVEEVGRIVQDQTGTPIVLYCNGPFCTETKKLAQSLLGEQYTNVKRYQLGLSVWRALGGVTQVELAGVAEILAKDRTAVFIDARETQEFERRTLPGARNLPGRKLAAEKDSIEILESDNGEVQRGRPDEFLPMEDHNTRVIVFGDNEEQASSVAETLAREGFTNVNFFAGTVEELMVAAAADKIK